MYRLMPLVVVLVTCCWLVAGVQATQTGAADAARRAPIRLVVPFPPGGGGDFVARSVGYKLGEILGRQVVIDNRGGGGTTLASDLVAKAQPDGNTLLIVGTAHAVNPTRHEKLAFRYGKGFRARFARHRRCAAHIGGASGYAGKICEGTDSTRKIQAGTTKLFLSRKWQPHATRG